MAAPRKVPAVAVKQKNARKNEEDGAREAFAVVKSYPVEDECGGKADESGVDER